MTIDEAAKLLELPPDATPEQAEARFNELRAKLEDKIAKAPTPGLKDKYRRSLDDITKAFETLVLAADVSSLPVLQQVTSERSAELQPASEKNNPELRAKAPHYAGDTPAPAKSAVKTSNNREFLLVALIAVLLLGAGGWWVMKTRAENAERERVAAAAKVEAERKAAADRAEAERVAEAKRKAEEEEKERLAAEQERLDKLAGQLRGELAGYKVEWEAFEKEERNAERRLVELKSDLRSLRDPSAGQLVEAQAMVAAQQAYYDWLSDTLARHPAKVARSKAEELLSARQPGAAQAAMTELKAAQDELEKLIPEQRRALVDIEGDLALSTDSDVAWTLTDAFGRTRSGKGSVQLDGLAVGPGRVQLSKSRWPAREEKFVIRRDRPVELSARYQSHTLVLGSAPDGAEVRMADGIALGVTPLRLEGFPPGPLPLTLHKEGYYNQKLELTLPTLEPDGPVLTLRAKPTGLVKPPRWISPARVTVQARIVSGGSNSNKHTMEEWDLAQPDPATGWRQVVRKFGTFNGFDARHVPASGSVMRQQRQPDGKWSGEFTQGGLPDPTNNYIWTSQAPSVWLVSLGVFDVWPPDEVPVGGSWPVKPEVFFPMIGLTNATGQVHGRLVSIERESEAERAVVEFQYNYSIGGMAGQAVLKAQIDLTDCYLTRIEGRDAISGSSSISSSYTTTVTKR